MELKNNNNIKNILTDFQKLEKLLLGLKRKRADEDSDDELNADITNEYVDDNMDIKIIDSLKKQISELSKTFSETDITSTASTEISTTFSEIDKNNPINNYIIDWLEVYKINIKDKINSKTLIIYNALKYHVFKTFVDKIKEVIKNQKKILSVCYEYMKQFKDYFIKVNKLAPDSIPIETDEAITFTADLKLLYSTEYEKFRHFYNYILNQICYAAVKLKVTDAKLDEILLKIDPEKKKNIFKIDEVKNENELINKFDELVTKLKDDPESQVEALSMVWKSLYNPVNLTTKRLTASEREAIAIATGVPQTLAKPKSGNPKSTKPRGGKPKSTKPRGIKPEEKEEEEEKKEEEKEEEEKKEGEAEAEAEADTVTVEIPPKDEEEKVGSAFFKAKTTMKGTHLYLDQLNRAVMILNEIPKLMKIFFKNIECGSANCKQLKAFNENFFYTDTTLSTPKIITDIVNFDLINFVCSDKAFSSASTGNTRNANKTKIIYPLLIADITLTKTIIKDKKTKIDIPVLIVEEIITDTDFNKIVFNPEVYDPLTLTKKYKKYEDKTFDDFYNSIIGIGGDLNVSKVFTDHFDTTFTGAYFIRDSGRNDNFNADDVIECNGIEAKDLKGIARFTKNPYKISDNFVYDTYGNLLHIPNYDKQAIPFNYAPYSWGSSDYQLDHILADKYGGATNEHNCQRIQSLVNNTKSDASFGFINKMLLSFDLTFYNDDDKSKSTEEQKLQNDMSRYLYNILSRTTQDDLKKLKDKFDIIREIRNFLVRNIYIDDSDWFNLLMQNVITALKSDGDFKYNLAIDQKYGSNSNQQIRLALYETNFRNIFYEKDILMQPFGGKFSEELQSVIDDYKGNKSRTLQDVIMANFASEFMQAEYDEIKKIK